MQATLEILVKCAGAFVVKFGTFDPLGLVLTVDGKSTILDSAFIVSKHEPPESFKGISGNKANRKLEDLIRRTHQATPLAVAAMIYDARFRPVEGGKGGDAMIAHLEEKPGIAIRVITPYEVKDGKIALAQRQISQHEHHFLAG